MIDRETDAGDSGADDKSVVQTNDASVATTAPERDFDTVRNELADKLLAGEDVGGLETEIAEAPKGPNRGPDGKFAAKAVDDAANAPPAAPSETRINPAAALAPQAEQPPVAKPADASHGRAAPSWLAPEAKDAWDKAPPPVVDAFMKRAREFETANSTLGRDNKVLKDYAAAHQPFEQVAERHRAIWEGAGVHPAEYMDRLMQGQQLSQADPIRFTVQNVIGDSDPRAFIGALAQAYNIDFTTLALEGVPAYQAPQPQQHQPAQQQIDPNAIYQRAREETQAEFTTRQNQAILDHFRSQTPVIGRNEYGETVHEFDELGDDLAIVVQRLQKANPNLGTYELLNAAYSKAVLLNENANARRMSAEQAAAKAASAEAAKNQAAQNLSRSAKKAAGINVTGSPNRNPGPVDVRALQMQELDSMGYAH
jgi:hypothetical protein